MIKYVNNYCQEEVEGVLFSVYNEIDKREQVLELLFEYSGSNSVVELAEKVSNIIDIPEASNYSPHIFIHHVYMRVTEEYPDLREQLSEYYLEYVTNIDLKCVLGTSLNKFPNIPEGWRDLFNSKKFKIYYSMISETIHRKEETFFPLFDDIFRAFHLTSKENLKVVILGQDPYHQVVNIAGERLPRAMGLSFSVRKGDRVAYSLGKIYSQMENSVTRTVNGVVEKWKRPNHGDLSNLARQGILFLNTYLTVRPNEANSHKSIWRNFVKDVVIDYISINCEGVIFVLWGGEANKITSVGGKNYILSSCHPAYHAFKNITHFNDINDILLNQEREPIDWFDI